MKKILIAIACLSFLTACPNKQEIENMTEGIAEKKSEAIKIIDSNDFSTEGLMKAQNYFFDFGEKVHLIKVEEQAQQNVQKMIKKKGTKVFCDEFVLPLAKWQILENYCSSGQFYKCSPDIKEYSNTLNKLKELVGKDIALLMNNESSCK